MGNSASLYDVRLDGETITDLPKSLYEPLQMLMNGHQTLIVIRKPEIVERSIDIEGSAYQTSAVMQESLYRFEKAISDQQKQITDAINATISTTISDFNTQVNQLTQSINDCAKRPINDSNSIKTTIDLLAGRVNDMANAISNTFPTTLSDRFNNQTERLIESINETLHPKDSLNATIKGAAYEVEVMQGFESLNIPTLSIERVSTDTACCDIHVIDTASKILFAVECKNYSRNVGDKEVAKFYRDLSELKRNHGNQYKAIIGMFLSKQTNIVKHGAIDIDEHGNIFLASQYNNPLMWHAIMTYYNRIYNNKNEIMPTEGEDHMKVLLAAYNAMKDSESIAELISKNINRLSESLKDLKTMSDRIKPISEIIDRFANLYGLTSDEKPKNKKTSKKDSVKSEPIGESSTVSKSSENAKRESIGESSRNSELTTVSEESQMVIDPFSDYGSDTPVDAPADISPKEKPKRKYTKRTNKSASKSEPPITIISTGTSSGNHSSIGWSDDDW